MLIRKRIIVLTVLPLIIATLTISGVLTWTVEKLLFKRSFEHQKSLTDRLAWALYEGRLASLKNILHRQERVFDQLIKTGHQALSLGQQEQYMNDLLKRIPEFTQFEVLDASGWQEIKLAKKDNEVVIDQNYVNKAVSVEFLLAIKGRDYVSPVFVWEGASHINIVVPLKDTVGNVTKVLKASVNLGKVWHKFTRELPAGATAYLVDNHGNVIAHSEGSSIYQKRNISHLPIIQDFLSGIPCYYDRNVVYETFTGIKVLGIYSPIPELGWGVVVEQPVKEVYKPLYIMLAVAGGVTILSLAGFLSWSVISARRVTSRMTKLHEATEVIAGGNLDYKIEIKGRDEISLFANALNKMTGDLQKARIEIEQRTVQLEAANKELEAFAYSVSHDLRAPLRSIDGFSQAVLEDYADKLDAQGKNYLGRIRTASQRMGQLIDDLLKLSRATRSEMKYETVDLGALARTIVVELQKMQPERQVEFIIKPGLFVNGDVRLLRIMLKNLLDNAWKFTAKRSRARIEFGVTQHEGKSVYFVSDDGAGFDMTYADKLFAPFQRLHAATEFQGTGIGLATVQRIIRRHGGNIWVKAEVEKGATFYFTL